MKHLSSFLILALPVSVSLTISTCLSQRRTVILPTAPLVVSRAEEVAVYSALLNHALPELSGRTVVIDDKSGDCPPAEREPDWQEILLGRMPEVSAETFGDYVLKNAACSLLSANTDLAKSYRIISDAEVMEVIRGGEAEWSGFYLRHPNAAGFLVLSRIGFNPEMNQALVYVGLYSGDRRGSGYHVLLSKTSGTWVVEKRYISWST